MQYHTVDCDKFGLRIFSSDSVVEYASDEKMVQQQSVACLNLPGHDVQKFISWWDQIDHG